MRRWVEGKHAQVDFRYGSAWAGLALDRLMVGVVLNVEARSLGVGLGPLYLGVGT